MKREDQLEFCKVCNHKKLDLKQGIICKHTNAPADFEGSCELFEENPELKIIEESKKKEEAVASQTVGHGLRLANYLIDLVCLMLLVMGFTIIISSFNSDLAGSMEESSTLGDYLFGFMVGMFYYFIFEVTTGRTIGKLLTGTKVVTESGEMPGPKTIFIRSLCRHIPFEAFSFLGNDASGWHDSISDTRVVKA